MNLNLTLLVALWMTGNYFLHCTSDGVINVWPKTLTVTEGGNISINCSTERNNTDTSRLNFTWSRSEGGTVLSNLSLLTLQDVKRIDSGNYSCTATNGTANWSAVATLTVRYPPNITYSTSNLTVNESSKAALFCNASGYPSPVIQWRLPNGSAVPLSNNEFLELGSTSKSQRGKYSCQATNTVGNSSTEVMYLNVQYKPRINSTGRENNISSRLHLNSTLTCQADGNPRPVVTWSKDSKLLWGHTETIHITPENDTAFGVYRCTAGNALGEDIFNVSVVRTAFPPEAPKLLNNETQLSNRSLLLRWESPQNNGRPIFRFFVWYRNSSEGRWTKKDVNLVTSYSVTLQWATGYQFAVTAENDQGESVMSKTLNFTVPPKPTSPTGKPTSSSTPSRDFKTVLFACIGGGIGLLVIVAIATVICVKRRRRGRAQPMRPLVNLKELQPKLSESSPSTLQNSNTYNPIPMSPRNFSTSPARDIYSNVSYEDEENLSWEFPREKVHIEKYVGKGAFCVVAKAFVEGLGIVAVKTPKEKAPKTNKKDLLAEYELMKPLRHPNVIQLMGAVTRSDPVMVLFEYIPYGDLLGFLKRSRGLEDKYYKDPDVKPSSWLTSEQLLKFAREIADGMAYLAANKIIHRDLAARNVLVGEAETCKLTDFGMARDVRQDDIYQKRSKGRLPVKWTAIESLLYGICTTQSDVWSYGIVLYEIFTIGGKPYPNIQAHKIPYLLQDDYRMPKPVHLDDEIYALMCECWQTDPDRRPRFESISSTIKRLQRCHKEIIYMNVYDDNLYGNVEDWD